LGRRFTLRTDHSGLKWLQTLKELEGQLAQWLEQLQEYEFEIIRRTGKKHSNADAMSCSQCNCNDCVQNNAECSMGEIQQQPLAVNGLGNENTPLVIPAGDRSLLLPSTGTSNDSEFNGMQVAQLDDDILGPIFRLKEVNQQPGEVALAGMGHEARQLHQQ